MWMLSNDVEVSDPQQYLFVQYKLLLLCVVLFSHQSSPTSCLCRCCMTLLRGLAGELSAVRLYKIRCIQKVISPYIGLQAALLYSECELRVTSRPLVFCGTSPLRLCKLEKDRLLQCPSIAMAHEQHMSVLRSTCCAVVNATCLPFSDCDPFEKP